jgi:hypothetical protein
MTAARFSGRLPHLTSSLTSSPGLCARPPTNADGSKDDSGYGVIPTGSKMSTFKVSIMIKANLAAGQSRP